MSQTIAKNRAIKLKYAFGLFLPVLCLLVLVTVVLAQDVPAPYAGMKNPFKWDDTAAQSAGKSVYNKNCLSCHGANGNEVEGVDFTAADAHKKLEDKPDFAFFRVSEGFTAKEMPVFKFTLPENQRWQVITYLWSLGAIAAPPPLVEPPPVTQQPGGPSTGANVTANVTTGANVTAPPVVTPPTPPLPKPPPSLRLTVPEKAEAGQPLQISALLQQDGKPIPEVPVTFSLNTTFLIGKGLAEIGEATTDEKGVADITFTPKQTGYIPFVARYQTSPGKFVTAVSTIKLEAPAVPPYETEVGLPYKGFPSDLVLFPTGAFKAHEPGTAPVSVLRIPGGLPFFLFTAYLGVVVLVWCLYLRVMYQVFRIPTSGKIAGKMKDPDTRLLPTVGLPILVLLAALLVWILITPPYFVSFG